MTLGIVGGLSPEITAEFYLRLVEKSRIHGSAYPHVIIDSVPLDFVIEKDIICDSRSQEKLLSYLIDAVSRLQNTDAIAVPCNTAHIFIQQMCEHTDVPIISIVEEVSKRLKDKGIKKAGLLATSTTVNSGIYSAKSIDFVLPSRREQRELDRIILKIVRNEHQKSDENRLAEIADSMKSKCGNAVLACTDLRRILKGNYVDSFNILAEAVFKIIGGEEDEERFG